MTDYTTKQVSKLTGLSPRQLQYLDEQGHVPATTVAGNGRAGQRRSWSEGQLQQMLRLAGIRKKYKLHFKSIPPSGKVVVICQPTKVGGVLVIPRVKRPTS